MSHSSFNFPRFREAIISISTALAEYHNTPVGNRPQFQRIAKTGTDASIFCQSPYSHIQATIRWEISTKGEWTKNGYTLYVQLQQTIHRDGEPFIESLLKPAFGIKDIQDWFRQENIKLYWLPKTKFDDLTISLVFYLMPHR